MVLGRGGASWERRVLPFCMNMSYFIFLCFRHFPPVALRFRPFRAPRIATIWFDLSFPWGPILCAFYILLYYFLLTGLPHHISHLLTYISSGSDVVLLHRTKPIPWVDLADQLTTPKGQQPLQWSRIMNYSNVFGTARDGEMRIPLCMFCCRVVPFTMLKRPFCLDVFLVSLLI